MDVLKTFKTGVKCNNLPRLLHQQPQPKVPQTPHPNSPPRTNLKNFSHAGMPTNCSFARPATQSSSTLTRSMIIKRRIKSNLLLFFTLIAVAIGILLGLYLRSLELRSFQKTYFGFLGELFLRMLKFVIVPLIGSSLVCGIASLGASKITVKVASRAFIYYIGTTFLAVVLGLVLVMFIKPGNRVKTGTSDVSGEFSNPLIGRKISPLDTIFDLFRNLFPDNIVQMAFMQYESRMVPKYKSSYVSLPKIVTESLPINNISTTTILNNITNLTETITTPTTTTPISTTTTTTSDNLIVRHVKEIDYWHPVPGERYGINVLGLVMFCFTLGYVLPQMKGHGKVLLDFFEAVNRASVKIIEIIMMFSPIGICSLICHAVLTMDNPKIVFEKISYYLATVFLGLLIHGLIVLPLLYVILTKKNVFVYANNMFEALLVAFATSSSNAALSVTLKCVEQKNRVPKPFSRFVLPVGATINMDGTALYEAVAAIFIAQLNNIELKFVDYVVASLTATVASIGAAGLPSSGLVTMVIVLSALNLPQTQISLIYCVDWLLDRFRTTVNVWGDAVGTGIVAHLSRFDLETSKIDRHKHILDFENEKKEITCHAEQRGDLEEDSNETNDDDDQTMPEELEEEPKKRPELTDKTFVPLEKPFDTTINFINKQQLPKSPKVISINEGFVAEDVKNNETTF